VHVCMCGRIRVRVLLHLCAGVVCVRGGGSGGREMNKKSWQCARKKHRHGFRFAHLQRRVRWREVGFGSDCCLLSLQELSLQERQQRWVLRSTPTNHPQVSDFFCRIHTRALDDRPSFPLRVYLSQAFRRCLFEYMYNPPRTILSMHLRGTAYSSEEKVLHIRQSRLNFKEWWYGSSSIVG